MALARRPSILVLALCLAFSPGLGPGLAAAAPFRPNDTEAALSALRKAERHVEEARYGKAVTAYKRIASEWPDTPAGRIAAERSRPTAFLGSADIVRKGPSVNRVDVVVMGDGYTIEHQEAFDKVAKVVPRLFDHNPTLSEYSRYFNFIRANCVSKDAGVDGFGREYDTALGAYTRGTWQGHVATDHDQVMAMLDQVPEHDGLVIAYVKRGILGTGGRGVATIGGRAERTTIHEWGHAFAGLADEYTYDNGGHSPVLAASSANVANTDDPRRVPWRHFLDADVSDIDIYQGGAGRAKGVWKATASSCLMEYGDFFCRVCREAIVLRIHDFVDPIESCQPAGHALTNEESLRLSGRDTCDLVLTVMRPQSHKLRVRWWVLPDHAAPAEPRPLGEPTGTRRDRGPLSMIETRPDKVTRSESKGKHAFRLRADALSPGRYRVVARAGDDTKLKGDRYPWVLKDEHDLLQSERAWWLIVE